jgi:hypothetical protein
MGRRHSFLSLPEIMWAASIAASAKLRRTGPQRGRHRTGQLRSNSLLFAMKDQHSGWCSVVQAQNRIVKSIGPAHRVDFYPSKVCSGILSGISLHSCMRQVFYEVAIRGRLESSMMTFRF